MRKRHQHYVWKAYLRAWSVRGRAFCLQGGRIFSSHIDDLAVQRDFYKVPILTKGDIQGIRLLVANSPKEAMRVHRGFVEQFAFAGWLKQTLEPAAPGNSELQALIDEKIYNLEEDIHGGFEQEFLPILGALRRRDLGFYQDPELCGRFLHFICLQWLRTRPMRERVLERTNVPLVPGFDIVRCWNVLRHVFAVNAAASLLRERKRRPLQLLINQTAIPLITGDQPVINLLRHPQRLEPPAGLALYYPLSPQLAILLDETSGLSGYTDGLLTLEQVDTLNREIHAVSHSQVYALSQETLAVLFQRSPLKETDFSKQPTEDR